MLQENYRTISNKHRHKNVQQYISKSNPTMYEKNYTPQQSRTAGMQA